MLPLARLLLLATLAPVAALAQQVPQTDTSVIDPDGTAHITRVIPLPAVLSPEAHAALAKPASDAYLKQPVQERRKGTDAWQTAAGKRSLAAYPVKVTEGQTMAGVPVRIFDPIAGQAAGPVEGPGSPQAQSAMAGSDPAMASDGGRRVAGMPGPELYYSALATLPCHPATRQSAPVHAGPPNGDTAHPQLATPTCRAMAAPQVPTPHPDRVLLCLHGGGFNSDSGSYTEAIPLANLTGIRVVSALYRLSPENPYPAALEDAVAVYRELLRTYAPGKIGVFGTSAGAILSGELAVRLKELGLPQPGALGIFSGFGDFTAPGDSLAFFSLNGLSGHLEPPPPTFAGTDIQREYLGSADPHDPVLSPDLADLHGLPPTLFISSTRDLLLSGTVTMERAWARDGVTTEMTIFDALPHAFWNSVELPESREAYATMARFFLERLGSATDR